MGMKSYLLLLSLFFVASPMLTACSGGSDKDDDETVYKEEPADELYSQARAALAERNYDQAIELFDEVERQHPYSDWAARAQIMAAYTHYDRQKYDDAVLTLERFVKLHPGHESADYAYYMIALCYYEQISDVGRDQSVTKQAMDALREVIKRFPNSDYARDAKLKVDLTEDHLAGKEMMIGRYYLEQEEYLAAVNRFRLVIDAYQTTSHVPEALHRLVETYMLLGITDEAKRYAAVLGHNFPGSDWYQYSYSLINEGKSLPAGSDDDDSMWDIF